LRPAGTFLFAADMDGTLLPNTGQQPVDGCLRRTRNLLRILLRANCPVCFISGRHLTLARDGQQEFGLPEPDYWVCNVGTEIHDRGGNLDRQWQQMLGPAFDHREMCQALDDLEALTLQEAEKQGPHKLSFYVQGKADINLLRLVLEHMKMFRPDLRLVDSVEESTNRGLLDILPENSGKSAALYYLAEKHGFAPSKVFFAGDSGNDRDALLSGVRGALVGNAPDEVRSDLQRALTAKARANIYFADACYGDGIIEGLNHFGFLESP